MPAAGSQADGIDCADPSGLKLHNGQGKYIFKKALQAILPPAILNRPKKGFAVPVAEWFRSDLKEFAYEALFRPCRIRC